VLFFPIDGNAKIGFQGTVFLSVPVYKSFSIQS
jgi:hypothetical protein